MTEVVEASPAEASDGDLETKIPSPAILHTYTSQANNYTPGLLHSAVLDSDSIMSTDPKFDQFHGDMFNLGLQNRREVVGNEYVANALKNGSSEFAYPGQELVTE